MSLDPMALTLLEVMAALRQWQRSGKLRVVGVGGRRGSGKSLACNVLAESMNAFRCAFADPLKEAVASMFGLPLKQCYTEEGKARRLPLMGGITIGRALQLAGTEGGRKVFGEDVWVRLLMGRLLDLVEGSCSGEGVTCVIEDVRFDNEADALVDIGGRLLWIDRTDGYSIHDGRDPQHASEPTGPVGRDPSKWVVLQNDGTPDFVRKLTEWCDAE